MVTVGSEPSRPNRVPHAATLNGTAMRAPSLNHDSRHRQLELVLAWANVAWLQVVGLQTHTVVHHVLHALPLSLLAVLPRTPWIRHGAAMAGLMRVVMLSLLSPMIAGAMREGIHIGEPGLAYTWLAPAMLLLAAAWSAVNLSRLGDRPSRWPVRMLAIAVAGVVLGWIQPISGACSRPR
jgi:hypothetical protein